MLLDSDFILGLSDEELVFLRVALKVLKEHNEEFTIKVDSMYDAWRDTIFSNLDNILE